jgi:hypothetical protein
LHRPLVPQQHLAPVAFPQRALLDVQEQFHFPFREGIPLNAAA